MSTHASDEAYIAAVEAAGSPTAYAKQIGKDGGTERKKYRRVLARLGRNPNLSPSQVEKCADFGIPEMQLQGGWIKDKGASYRFTVPQQERDQQDIIDSLKEGLKELPKAKPLQPSKSDDELLSVYPVADLHIGLLTDEEEVGEDWDTKKAVRVFRDTFGRLIDVTPGSGLAIIAQIGDLMHNDDQYNVTPASKHQLDVDSRYFLVLRRSVQLMKWAIDELRKKHTKVIYRGCRGNHDPMSHYAVTLALAEHYRDCPSVHIEESAAEFYVKQFGQNMLILHHGDKAKPERLALFAADQYAGIWGKTKHRLAISGHVHHETKKEVGGMVFESVGTIIPRDAYAMSHGYSAKRSLVSICLHREDGEVSRARVNI